MSTSRSFSALITSLRPVSRLPFPHRSFATSVRPRRVSLIHQKSLRAPFTTSPTRVPPQTENSINPSASEAPISAGDPAPGAPSVKSAPRPSASPNTPDEPRYQLTFTCKPCKERSSHEISKQGYHSGSVLITCPGCKARHVISDHLKFFSDKAITIEDIMRSKGELVRRGSISSGGDIEFWDEKENAA